LAIEGTTAVGCGALRGLEVGGRDDVAEIKRMYATRPGSGIGVTLLRALEERARVFGYTVVMLETRRINVTALGFYARHGYVITENYGPYVGRADAVCLSKSLAQR
jgi:putative acetyltransferase